MALSEIEFLQGALTLVSVLVSVILGISIMTRYKKVQQRELLLVGATWIFLFSGYWPDSLNFISSIAFDLLIRDTLYLILATAFYAPIHILWMYVVSELLFKERQKKIMKFFWIEAIIYEIILISVFIINPAFVGEQTGPFSAVFSDFVMIYFFCSLLLFVITGILFSRFFLKSTENENRRKGYLLITAFLSFLIGISLDNFVLPVTEITLFIARLFHMTAALEFYFGFAMKRSTK